jgi:hypothetical protein
MSYSIADLIIVGMAFFYDDINANNWNEDGISETATQITTIDREAPL